jgi:LysM repeat protein
MHGRPVALAAAAGVLALALGGAPQLARTTRAAEPAVIVGNGDTLSGIAVRHRTTVARLVALNHLADPNRIYVGQRLVVGTGAAAPSTSGSKAAAAPPRVHLVRAGEHLTGIAEHYGTTIDAIVRLNGLANPNRIIAGQRLLIPAPATEKVAPKAASAVPIVTHRVAPGENLTAIAARYRTSIGAIAALNGLVDASYIRAGDLLRIPDHRQTGTPTPTQAAPLPADVARRMTSRAAIRDRIVAEAHAAGVPAAFALAVAWQESGWQQNVVSSAGAVGVMQLLPATCDWIAGSILHAPVVLGDTRQNIRAGVALLAHYLARYHGSRSLALAAYYQGQRSVDVHGVLPISRPYITSILALQALLGG